MYACGLRIGEAATLEIGTIDGDNGLLRIIGKALRLSTCRRSPTGWGVAATTLMPLVDVIRAHVFAAERIHADDTTVPVLAKNKTRAGRLGARFCAPFGERACGAWPALVT